MSLFSQMQNTGFLTTWLRLILVLQFNRLCHTLINIMPRYELCHKNFFSFAAAKNKRTDQLCYEQVNSALVFCCIDNMSQVMRKPVFGISDQVRLRPVRTATKDGQRLEISDLGRGGIVLSMQRKQRR